MQTSPKVARQVVTPFPPGRLPELYNPGRTPMQACHAMDAIVPPSRAPVCQPDIIHGAQAYTRPARSTSLIGMEPAGMNHKTVEQHPQHITFEPGKTSFMNLPGRKPLPYMTRYFRNPFPGIFDFGGSHIGRIKLEHRHIGVGHKDRPSRVYCKCPRQEVHCLSGIIATGTYGITISPVGHRQMRQEVKHRAWNPPRMDGKHHSYLAIRAGSLTRPQANSHVMHFVAQCRSQLSCHPTGITSTGKIEYHAPFNLSQMHPKTNGWTEPANIPCKGRTTRR